MYRSVYSILVLVFICGCYASQLRIVDGDIVKSIEEYPFMASIRSFSDSFCGGTILSRRYVLTAAHCIYQLNGKEPLPPRFASVRVGSLSKSSGGKIYQVEEIKLNPFWRKFEHMIPFYGDDALIKLKEDIEYNEKVQPVILPAVKNYSLRDESTVIVMGYGRTKMETEEVLQDESYEKNDALRSTKMQVYNNKKCIKDWNEFMSKLEDEHDQKIIMAHIRIICLKGEGDFCNGDSGGPAIDENNVQVGIISFNMDCSEIETPLPSGVTDIRPWLWWINLELSKEI
ncbi:chymotrypsin-1-like [Trichogramma pretiosum]|uniref:chymotrypsin-1-like n=1 Tax=Trichogramma pretiosum TaxID=7493 RepID=UPI000C718D3A|nr:chymotrypsin-1-like [Trichogramma pretiosum]